MGPAATAASAGGSRTVARPGAAPHLTDLPNYLCAENAPLVVIPSTAFPYTWSFPSPAPYISAVGPRTCYYAQPHTVLYSCTGATTTTKLVFGGGALVNSHVAFPAVCDGRVHGITPDMYRSVGAYYHIHWHFDGTPWQSAQLMVLADWKSTRPLRSTPPNV